MTTPKGYCQILDISLHLGMISSGLTTLTTDQQTRANDLIAAAEAYIDRETRKGWLLPPITSERYTLLEPVLYLRSRPVASVQSIETRTTQVGDTLTTLTQGTDYELLDPDRGEVRFVAGYGASDPNAPRMFFAPSIAFVSYTPNLPVPADITLAATQIAAASLVLSIYPERAGMTQLQLAENATMQFSQDGFNMLVPATAQRIIDGYRLPIWA